MYFELLSEITDIERIAAGSSIREVARLRRQFGPGRWRKLKVLQRFASEVVGYERLSFAGTKPTASAEGR
jgi:hypothetical protein